MVFLILVYGLILTFIDITYYEKIIFSKNPWCYWSPSTRLFCRAIESITGLSKATVSRINKTIDGNKENKKGGRPSKLSPADQRRIANRITSGQLDNAVQAT